MRDEKAIYRRVIRRETHAARTAPAVVVAAVAAVVSVAVVVAGVWWTVDAGARDSASRWWADASSVVPSAVLVAGGAVAVLIALLLAASALLPGGRARRARTTDRVAVVIDDGVLADAVADAVSLDAGVERGRVSVTLTRREVHVRVTPTSGLALDEAGVAVASDRVIAALGLALKTRVSVASSGVIA